MTKNKRLELYWKMYTVAVGISMLMSPEQVFALPVGELPFGFCSMLKYYDEGINLDELPELMTQKRAFTRYTCMWYALGDWKPRAEALLRAIELASE